MKTIVLIISNLFLITAAPVDQHHDIEARSASDENAEFQTLLTEVRNTLANVNKPTFVNPPIKTTGLQLQEPPPPPVQTAYILNPLSPMSPPADVKPAQQASVPQINLFLSGLPQQTGATAAGPLNQTPLQQLMLANPEPIPIQSHAQVMTLPASFGSILPQNAVVMPVSIPSQMYPNMIRPLQSPVFLGPQFNPYLQPVNPLGAQGFGPFPFNPQMYNPNPYNPNPYNYGMPNVAISPPIIFRERGQTATTQGV